MLDAMLKKFGYKATMLSLGVGFFAVNSVSLIAIRRRIPLAPVSAHRRARIEWRHLLTWAFACGFLVLLLTSLGNFNPTLWIPSGLMLCTLLTCSVHGCRWRPSSRRYRPRVNHER